MRKTVNVLGVPVDSITMQEAVGIIKTFLDRETASSIYTPNAEIIMAAQRDSSLKEILIQADMLIADGAGVVLASKLLKVPVPEKVSGVDLVKRAFAMDYHRKLRVFIFGAKPGVAEIAAGNIQRNYPNVEIVGCRNGYFSKTEEDEIIELINSSGPDILLVGLGAPQQENWIHRNKPRLKAKACMGIGGSIDVIAGTVALAPEVMRRNGLEWLFRLYKEPRRYKRMLDLPRFVILTLAVRFGLRKV